MPVLSKEEKKAAAAVLRLNFPVSSGMQHRVRESEWEPVTTSSASSTTATATEAAPEREVTFPGRLLFGDRWLTLFSGKSGNLDTSGNSGTVKERSERKL